jgi:hypothetical protein
MKKTIKNIEAKAIKIIEVKGGADRVFYHWGTTVSTSNP